jgi:hypothetical protein
MGKIQPKQGRTERQYDSQSAAPRRGHAVRTALIGNIQYFVFYSVAANQAGQGDGKQKSNGKKQ